MVEDQYRTSTRKLVDSNDEQRVLEELIDGVKPPPPRGPKFEGLHYLLSTPFRHPPLPHGSRFGRRHERGAFYGAKKLGTTLAEVAYYRLVFLEGTAADLAPLETRHSAFSVRVKTRRGLDLTEPPYVSRRRVISSPTDYSAAHELGSLLRKSGVEACVFHSARDPAKGHGVALFEPCFAAREPSALEAWTCVADKRAVEFQRAHALVGESVRFSRELFLVKGELPAPAV